MRPTELVRATREDLILEAKGLPDEVPAMAQRIRRAVDRMARVVDDMLALSTSGRPPKGESTPAVVVGHVVEDMGAELHDITVATEVAPGRVACADDGGGASAASNPRN